MFALSAMAIFPLFALLWLLICDMLGLVEDQPEGQGRDPVGPGNDTQTQQDGG